MKGDTKEEYEAMINNHVNASKALRTYIGTHHEIDGSSMKDFDNIESLLNEEAESTPGMCVWIDSFLIIIFACNNTVFYPWLLAEMERKRKCWYKKSLKKFMKDNGKKSKKGDRKYKGWLEGGKKFVLETVKAIKEEEDNGMQLKWEEMYMQLLDVMKGAEASEVDEEDNDIVEVDYGMMYEEV
jgi:hypothetical protein